MPAWNGKGRPPRVERREVVNAIFYVLRTGCQWRYLPEGFPAWQTVYWYFTRWTEDGTWERVNDHLRRAVRTHLGREPDPSVAIMDSQSVKTTEKGGTEGTTRARRSKAASATSWSTATGT
jgi:putative transposase